MNLDDVPIVPPANWRSFVLSEGFLAWR